MAKMIVDATTRAKYFAVSSCTEICDESGTTIGYFTPAGDDRASPAVSSEELDRRESERQTFSTSEVKEYLERR
ncbi:MAG: hypothetical protein MI757_23070 [Pirellulales bacterium]|nr:hypothetical protein [Pirellulales bacterium]